MHLLDRCPFAPTTIRPGLSYPKAIDYYSTQSGYFTLGVRLDF